MRDIKNVFEHGQEGHYKPVRVGYFQSNYNAEPESNDGRNKTLSIEKILNKIRPYLKDMINDLKKPDTCKIRLSLINFVSSKDNLLERVMHSRSGNIEFIIYDNADKVIEELFKSLLNRYQIGFEASTRGSEFIFACVYLLHYKCHKTNCFCLLLCKCKYLGTPFS